MIINANQTVYFFGEYNYTRSGLILLNAESNDWLETTLMLVATTSNSVEQNGYLQIIASSIDFTSGGTRANDYYLWNGQLCVHNKQSLYEKVTAKFFPTFFAIE